LFIFIAFLCGSVPFGLLIGRMKGIDIREHGSKNIGATNVGRVLGMRYFYLCFLLDFLKGFLPVFLAGRAMGVLGESHLAAADAWWWLGVMVGAVLGHVYTPWLKFKGGKGVATSLGAMLAVFPWLTVPGVAVCALWLIVVGVSRYVSLGSIVGGACLPVFAAAWPLVAKRAGVSNAPESLASAWPFIIVTSLLAALVIYKHRANIGRLRAGTERRMGEKAKTMGA
jgi:glycerol-3-phosphate acyltransferase PlsY